MSTDLHTASNAGESRRIVEAWIAEGTLAEHLPEVAALRGVPQPQEFHAEGDAFTHTMLAVAEVADSDDPRLFWGVLLHDIGKSSTTEFVRGRWRSHGHDRVGSEMALAAMARLGLPEMAEDVAWLVRNHLFHFSWNLKPGETLSPRQRRFTAHPLFPLLLMLCRADAAASRSPGWEEDPGPESGNR